MASKVPKSMFIPPHLRAKHRAQGETLCTAPGTVVSTVNSTGNMSDRHAIAEPLVKSENSITDQAKSFVQEDHEPDKLSEPESKAEIEEQNELPADGIQHIDSSPTVTGISPRIKRLEEAEEHMREAIKHFQAYLTLKDKPGDWIINDEPSSQTHKLLPSDSQNHTLEKEVVPQTILDSNTESAGLEELEILTKVNKHIQSSVEGTSLEQKSSLAGGKVPTDESSVHASDLKFSSASSKEGYTVSLNSKVAIITAPTPQAHFEVQKFLDKQILTSQPETSDNKSSVDFQSIKDGKLSINNVSNKAGDDSSRANHMAASLKTLSPNRQIGSRGLPRNTRGGGCAPRRTCTKVPNGTVANYFWNAPHRNPPRRGGVITTNIFFKPPKEPVDEWGEVEWTATSSKGVIKEKPVPVLQRTKYLVTASSSSIRSEKDHTSGVVLANPTQQVVYETGPMRLEEMDAEQAKVYNAVNKWRHSVDNSRPLIISHEALLSNFDSDIALRKWSRNCHIDGKNFGQFYLHSDITLLEYDEGDFDPSPYWKKFKGQNSCFLLPLETPNCELDRLDVFYEIGKASPTSDERAQEFLEQETAKESERKIADQIYRYGMRLATPDSNRPPRTYVASDTDGWGPEPSEVGRHKAACRNEIYKPKSKESEIKKEESIPSLKLGHPLRSQPMDLQQLLNDQGLESQSLHEEPNGTDHTLHTKSESSDTSEKKREEEARALRVLTSRRRNYDLRVADIEKDAIQIQRIYNQSVKGGPTVLELKELNLYDIVQRMGDASNETIPWIVAVTNQNHQPTDTVIAFGYVVRRTSNKDTMFSQVGQLQIVVDLKWRKAGVGTALLQQMSNMVQPFYTFDSAVKFIGERPCCKFQFLVLMVDCFYFETDDSKNQLSRLNIMKRWMKRNKYQYVGNMRRIAQKHNISVNCAIFQLDCRRETY